MKTKLLVINDESKVGTLLPGQNHFDLHEKGSLLQGYFLHGKNGIWKLLEILLTL